jgi:hypothetical protein
MKIRLSLFLLTTLRLTAAVSQDSMHILEIEKAIATLESTIASRVNIGEYIRPVFADDGGGTFLKHHYTIDTAKRILYKAVHDFVGFEQVTIYYNNQKTIKAVVSGTSSKVNPYKCEYYFDNDSIISIKEVGMIDPKRSWNKQTVISQSKQYLIDFAGICDMLDKRE